jgi:hypothetical protein
MSPFTTDKLPFAPSVTAVDFGFTSARQFWDEVVVRAHSRFLGHPSRQHAIEAAWAAWHVHDWVWRDRHAGTKPADKYTAFRDGLLNACPELAWMRDVADAGKHRGLGSAKTSTVARTRRYEGEVSFRPFGVDPAHAGASLRIRANGKDHNFADALEQAIDWWKTHHFSS